MMLKDEVFLIPVILMIPVLEEHMEAKTQTWHMVDIAHTMD